MPHAAASDHEILNPCLIDLDQLKSELKKRWRLGMDTLIVPKGIGIPIVTMIIGVIEGG